MDKIMDEIVKALKGNSGIRVEFDEGVVRKGILFSFDELIEMQVNVVHLLQNPGKYRVGAEGHRIIRKMHGQ